MIDARSHQLFEVDSDHRLVTVTQHRKNDQERAKTINLEKQNEPDKVLQILKEKKEETNHEAMTNHERRQRE